jgi:hypothetical protein
MVVMVPKDRVPRNVKRFSFVDIVISTGPERIGCIVDAVLIEIVFMKSEPTENEEFLPPRAITN